MTTSADFIIQADVQLFLWLNGMHNATWDQIMYWVTFKFTWIPLYIFLIGLTIKSDKKKALAILITVIAAVVIADKITSGLMKPFFMRLRPCHDPSLKGILHTVGDCGGLYGFASSHASTSFALGMAWYLLLKDKIRHIGWLLIWASVYAYSRVYVGVHYPADILVGAVVGLLTGTGCVYLYYTFLKKYYHN